MGEHDLRKRRKVADKEIAYPLGRSDYRLTFGSGICSSGGFAKGGPPDNFCWNSQNWKNEWSQAGSLLATDERQNLRVPDVHA